MARQYDLAERLMQKNQKPTITIDKDHVYKINNTAPAAMMIEQLGKDGELGQFEQLEKILLIALGKESVDYIRSLELTSPAYSEIVNAVMASIADISMEELEENIEENRFPGKKKRK